MGARRQSPRIGELSCECAFSTNRILLLLHTSNFYKIPGRPQPIKYCSAERISFLCGYLRIHHIVSYISFLLSKMFIKIFVRGPPELQTHIDSFK